MLAVKLRLLKLELEKAMQMHYHYIIDLFTPGEVFMKMLHAQSTLTDRYQTTIPESIRASLHLRKRDKISYTLEDNGKVLISRASEDDPCLVNF